MSRLGGGSKKLSGLEVGGGAAADAVPAEHSIVRLDETVEDDSYQEDLTGADGAALRAMQAYEAAAADPSEHEVLPYIPPQLHFISLDFDGCAAHMFCYKAVSDSYKVDTAHPIYQYVKACRDRGERVVIMIGSNRQNNEIDYQNYLRHSGHGYVIGAYKALAAALNDDVDPDAPAPAHSVVFDSYRMVDAAAKPTPWPTKANMLPHQWAYIKEHYLSGDEQQAQYTFIDDLSLLPEAQLQEALVHKQPANSEHFAPQILPRCQQLLNGKNIISPMRKMYQDNPHLIPAGLHVRSLAYMAEDGRLYNEAVLQLMQSDASLGLQNTTETERTHHLESAVELPILGAGDAMTVDAVDRMFACIQVEHALDSFDGVTRIQPAMVGAIVAATPVPVKDDASIAALPDADRDPENPDYDDKTKGAIRGGHADFFSAAEKARQAARQAQVEAERAAAEEQTFDNLTSAM
jgi:hypothetical protein